MRKRKQAASTHGGNLHGPDKAIVSAEVAEKRKTALGLRKQKMTYEAIAAAMGLSTPMVAWRYVQDALKAIPFEAAVEVKQLEIEDCRDDLRRLNTRLAEGKLTVRGLVAALGAKVKLREQLARYLGLYAPIRSELTGKDGAPLTLTMTDIQGMSDDDLDRTISAGRQRGASGGGAGAPAATPRASSRAH